MSTDNVGSGSGTRGTVVYPEAGPQRESPFVSRTKAPEPFTFVLFGATGDLAGRKLFPALASLLKNGYLPSDFVIVAVGRRDKTDEVFRDDVQKDLAQYRPNGSAGDTVEFLKHVFYQRTDFTTAEGMKGLAARLHDLEQERNLPGDRLFYLATDPEFFRPIVEGLAHVGSIRREEDRPWARVVIEKPFGRDLASALALDHDLLRFLRPDQIYRIDHYLGKDTVQNLLAFRFGNAIFEPLFNREHVSHVQITMAETVGMEGRRGAFYDHAGALRDVVQNHILQLLALVAMDPPATLKSGDISDAKLKVLRNLVPMYGAEVARHVVRGQYSAGTINGKSVRGYREEEAVDPASNTETYVALRALVESWRWAGVPFFLRTGKRLPRRVTEIAVQFKLPPMQLFRTVECEGDFCDLREAKPCVLVFRIQPDEGISLSFSAKRPGMQLDLHPVEFDFTYGKSFQGELPEAYERLLLDALRGDATLFMRSDELEAAWAFVTPILDAWQASPLSAIPSYPAGSWGPPEAERLIDARFGGWRRP
ncbi:MAG TPA: glucose-6-phosphate dehydrogenase [Gemmataceae bacterium]|jgi:glucose-6-phosphate 1-dehydrogenase